MGLAVMRGFLPPSAPVFRPAASFLMATLGLALSAAVAAAGPPAPPADLAELVAPRPGAELVAGETAWLEWRRGPGLAGFANAKEWEAFLSLDGGESYAVRLTPHLDLDRARVAFRVPPLVSSDVRLLLRFGDEGEEREHAVPARFRIVPAAAPLAVFRRRVPVPGEAARPGDAGVVLWAEGARDGSDWREVEAWDPFPALAPSLEPLPPAAVAEEPPEHEGPAAARGDLRVSRADPPTRSFPRPRAALAAQPLLFLLHRLNR